MTKARVNADNASADIQGVTAGTGLSGGGTSGTVTLDVDTTVIQARVANVSDTEIGYLDGVTSAIQTQIDGKQAVVAGVDSTEIGYLDGVTSAIQTQLDSKANTAITIDPETASYTPVLANAGQAVTMNVGSANTFSIPTDASVAFPVGTQITVVQTGTGQTTIQAVSSGVTTVVSTGATAAAPKLRVRYSGATCIKLSTDNWIVVGDIA